MLDTTKEEVRLCLNCPLELPYTIVIIDAFFIPTWYWGSM